MIPNIAGNRCSENSIDTESGHLQSGVVNVSEPVQISRENWEVRHVPHRESGSESTSAKKHKA